MFFFYCLKRQKLSWMEEEYNRDIARRELDMKEKEMIGKLNQHIQMTMIQRNQYNAQNLIIVNNGDNIAAGDQTKDFTKSDINPLDNLIPDTNIDLIVDRFVNKNQDLFDQEGEEEYPYPYKDLIQNGQEQNLRRVQLQFLKQE